jgi:hypothetical protein
MSFPEEKYEEIFRRVEPFTVTGKQLRVVVAFAFRRC